MSPPGGHRIDKAGISQPAGQKDREGDARGRDFIKSQSLPFFFFNTGDFY